ncbi:MAG: heat shock protein GrpE [Candidatus Methanofastidiosum methylothiophilum]|uniref:Protein GrpE n=1 Tax=Candidatus Methanofastidiosum methylothiophilum TaxID=1705564 RepID=A0A150ILE2_9EURY|nr:MAG: heat shock protein GrpE [Candidatus Methanofastidiosum methylthiophilus]KYC48001.1 MAG: heat shock protein GrpE [Candidatus Methanofastidiosum methylthiophilus]KYC50691.1 MAG: heat shock protein GrpE [Candidatus Methanofastidiosum methylthiophilus]
MEEENGILNNNEDKTTELQNKISELEKQLSESESKLKEIYERYLRSEADFQNLKKRTEKEKDDTRKYALQEVIMGILNVLDHIERGIKVYKESEKETLSKEEVLKGIELIYKDLKDVLGAHGLCEIECLGKEFDPYYHEALATICSEETEHNKVVEEFQKGYILNDRVIRPSRVKVTKNE